ncbi:unnamed protein product [Discula destructiva]
MLMIVGVYYG